MSTSHERLRRPPHRPIRLLPLLVTLALGMTACGSGETVEAGVRSDEPVPAEATDEPVTTTSGPAAENGYTPLTPRTDLVSLEPGTITEIVVDPDDDRRLLLHFQGAAEPCSGAAVTVEETDTAVVVDFRVGLDPNAAAMTCIAQVFDYEVVLSLAAPLGDRTINLAG